MVEAVAHLRRGMVGAIAAVAPKRRKIRPASTCRTDSGCSSFALTPRPTPPPPPSSSPPPRPLSTALATRATAVVAAGFAVTRRSEATTEGSQAPRSAHLAACAAMSPPTRIRPRVGTSMPPERSSWPRPRTTTVATLHEESRERAGSAVM